ncbi:MAG: hypothetical protein ACJ8C4_16515 [Gemmataceae bacterium]
MTVLQKGDFVPKRVMLLLTLLACSFRRIGTAGSADEQTNDRSYRTAEGSTDSGTSSSTGDTTDVRGGITA